MNGRNQEWALDVLYGEEARDLSADGYASAMHHLRGQGSSLAQKVDRALQPLREKDFPRRQIPWHETSIGNRYRVALLADNPHFRRDVALAREALGLPKGQVRCEVDNPIRLQLANSRLLGEEGEDVTQYLADRLLARRWIALHQEAFLDDGPTAPTEGLLPEALAVARRTELKLDGLPGTDWLKAEPPPHADCLWDSDLPLHLVATLLLERHRLPLHLCPSVMIHILTNSRLDLLGLEPQQILTLREPREIRVQPPSHTISVLIQGIDEYTTKADWDRWLKERINPVLEELWEERGQRPQGQQATNLERLREGLPLYERYLELGSLEQVLEEFQHADLPQGNIDDESARRLIRDLGELLEPGLAQGVSSKRHLQTGSSNITQ